MFLNDFIIYSDIFFFINYFIINVFLSSVSLFCSNVIKLLLMLFHVLLKVFIFSCIL